MHDQLTLGHGLCECECGCGEPVRRRFLPGHNTRLNIREFDDCYTPTHEGCWPWQGATDRDGYGLFSIGGIPKRAHRVAYERLVGSIPEGLYVLHSCDNPPCIRPEHLFLGTNLDNVADKMAKGRHVAGRTEWKLTRETANVIRDRYRAGGIYQRDLAAEYGISQSMVSLIVLGREWN